MVQTEAAVLLHGFTHTGMSWQPVRDELPPDPLVLAPDIRGHGTAGDLEPVGLEAVLEDLVGLVPPRSVLVGYSMGGRLALHAALSPGLAGRLRHLVLIGASPGIQDPGERAGRRAADERLAARIEAMAIGQFARCWERNQVLSGQPPEVLARVREDRLRSTTTGLARALRGLGTGALPSLWPRLQGLTVPVTMIVGERDEKFRPIAERMAGQIPDQRVLIVAGAGHAVHLEAPADVAGAILSSR